MHSGKSRSFLGLLLTSLLSIAAPSRADDETAQRKMLALIENKAATVQSVSASLTLQETMTQMDGSNPVECRYQKSGALIARRSSANPKMIGSRKSKKSKQPGRAGANEPDHQTSGAGAESPDVIFWSAKWNPPEYSKECTSTASRGVTEAVVYDGEKLNCLVRAAVDEAPLTQTAVCWRLGGASSAHLASLMNDFLPDFGVARELLPAEFLLPARGMFESWEQAWKLDVTTGQKLGKENVIVLDRTAKSASTGPSERFYYSKRTGMLLKFERRDPAGKLLLTLTLSDVKTNKPTPKGAFDFRPPAGVEVHEVDSTGQKPSAINH